MEILNAIVQVRSLYKSTNFHVYNFKIIFDLLILYYCGFRSLMYLILGTFLCMGIHPSAGHFVAEHYAFFEDQETYSYYGWWNLVMYNVGYHMEHHDFPYIPSRNLPKV